MIKVVISKALVEQAFTTGYKLDHAIEVTDGIPEGCRLHSAEVTRDGLELNLIDPKSEQDIMQGITVHYRR